MPRSKCGLAAFKVDLAAGDPTHAARTVRNDERRDLARPKHFRGVRTGDEPQRPGRRFESGAQEHPPPDHRLDEGQRQGECPGRARHGHRVAEVDAGAAGLFGQQHVHQAVLLDRPPVVGGETAGLDAFEHLVFRCRLEQPYCRVEQECAQLTHRNLKPRATMPRRISVAPPWIV